MLFSFDGKVEFQKESIQLVDSSTFSNEENIQTSTVVFKDIEPFAIKRPLNTVSVNLGLKVIDTRNQCLYISHGIPVSHRIK